MSIEVTILCDECGRVIDGAKTAAKARAAIREDGGRVNLPGGRDICPWCVAEQLGAVAGAAPTSTPVIVGEPGPELIHLPNREDRP